MILLIAGAVVGFVSVPARADDNTEAHTSVAAFNPEDVLTEDFFALEPGKRLEIIESHQRAFTNATPAETQVAFAIEKIESLHLSGKVKEASAYAAQIYPAVSGLVIEPETEAQFFLKSAFVHILSSDFERAFLMIGELRNIAEEHRNYEAYLNADTLLADIYIMVRDYDRAFSTYSRIYNNEKYVGTEFYAYYLDTLLNNMAFVSTRAGRPDDALDYLAEMTEVIVASDWPDAAKKISYAFVDANTARAYLAKNDYETTAALADRVLAEAEEIRQPYLTTIGLNLKGQAALGMGDIAVAREYLKDALAVLEEATADHELGKIYLSYARALEADGEPAEALSWLKKYIALSEKLSAEQNLKAIAVLNAEMGAQQRNLEIALLQEQRTSDRLFLAIAAGSAIFLVLGLLFVGRLYIVQHRSRKQLQEYSISLEKSEQNALAASKAKSEFLANMSHEIRTPMNGVLGMAELLQQTELSDKQKTFARTIYSSGTALLTIINDILDFSKIEAGKLELDPTPFNVEQAVEDVAALLGVTARQKGIELMVRMRPDVPGTLIGDVGRLRQVLTNLVGNAVKFTHEGSVLIDVSCDGIEDGAAAIAIAVSDTGIGIAPEKLDLVFEKFTQAESATTRKFGGTGLGLSITQSLITAMGGEIAVASTLGKGATFTVKLTLPVGEALTATAPSLDFFNGAQVLVVDDNEVNRAILEESLEGWYAAPIMAESGAAAIKILREYAAKGRPIPLALVDFHMPEMDGLQLVEEIRADSAIAATKIIVLSSVDSDELARAFKALNVADSMSKPARMAELKLAISNALNDSQVAALKETADALSQADASPAANRDSAVPKARILIAEDNVVNRMVIENMIDKNTIAIDFAENGKVAFEKARETRYDLILMDISMPEMDGEEATKAIRAHEKSTGAPSPAPIIALTAHAMAGDKDRFLHAGFDDYLPKPVKQESVDTIIQRWTDNRPDKKTMTT